MNEVVDLKAVVRPGKTRKSDGVFRTRSRLRARCALCLIMSLIFVAIVWNSLFIRSIHSRHDPAGAAIIARHQPLSPQSRLFASTSRTLPERPAVNPDAATFRSQCVLNRSNQLTVSAILPPDPTLLMQTLAQTCFQFDQYLPAWLVADQDGLRLRPEITSHMAGMNILDALPEERTWPVIQARGLPPETGSLHRQVGAWLREHPFSGVCINLADVPVLALEDWLLEIQLGGNRSCLMLAASQLPELPEAAIGQADQIFVQSVQAETAYIPGPVTQVDSINSLLSQLDDDFPEEKLTFLLSSGGKSWRSGRSTAQMLGFAEIMSMLNRYNTMPSFDPSSANSFAGFMDENGERHLLWFADVVTLYRQIRDAGLTRVAFRDVQNADPANWSLLVNPTDTRRLQNSDLSQHIVYSGAGPFHDFQAVARLGQRDIGLVNGEVISVAWNNLPLPWEIRRWGAPRSDLVALTFDDGPDIRYTGRILDILREHNVPATFFPIGAQMLGQKSLLERMYQDGHDIGLHTVTHAQLEEISTWRLTSELRLQQRMFASMTRRNSMLFRAPYVPGSGPLRADVARQMQAVDAMGYIVLGSDIVPPDWTGMTPEEIADYVVSAVTGGQGNVVLLHDGGGDRTSTVEALPLIIRQLKALGYGFTDAAGLIGQARADMMPPAAQPDDFIDGTSFAVAGFIGNNIHIGFAIIIAIGFLRGSFMLSGAICRRSGTVPDPAFTPSVSVIIPAYNEEKVIVRTVRAILASDYQNLSVLVVDDGSTDRTRENLFLSFSADPRVRIFSQHNQGKWAAANAGLRHSSSDIVVAIDADTLVDRSAIRFLIQRLADPRVGAVAGNVRVGNSRKTFMRLQSLEYIYAQQIERRMFEGINGMMVVPGAIGAWRRDAVQEVGGYSSQTLTEDADLTVSLIRAGYRVEFEERACTWTEAPENLKGFLAQRLRWTLGMIQTGWKHRSALRKRSGLGWFTLPDLLFFGVIMTLLAPLVDLFLLVAFLRFMTSWWNGTLAETNVWIFAGYALLPLLEVLSTAVALRFDGRQQYGLLWYFPLKRIFYRQLLTLTLYRALWRAISGRLARWNKLPRMASVQRESSSTDQVMAAE